jgi:hypothetical protein
MRPPAEIGERDGKSSRKDELEVVAPTEPRNCTMSRAGQIEKMSNSAEVPRKRPNKTKELEEMANSVAELQQRRDQVGPLQTMANMEEVQM